MEELSLDTQAILLLCGRLDRRRASAAEPLGHAEYARLAEWLVERELRPADLVQIGGRSHLHEQDLLAPERLERLLDRGTQLALQVEAWARKGIWVISRGDASYPRRWKQRLGHAAPPLIHGVGSPTMLNRGGVAIVGARKADEEALAYAETLARSAAASGLDVIAGGDRGIATAAMAAAVACEGSTVGVIAQNLERMMLEPQWRDGIVRRDLALISVDGPRMRAGAAHSEARTPLLYALADHAVVVAADTRGQTWSGVRALLDGGSDMLFVRDGGQGKTAAGNRALKAHGVPVLPSSALGEGGDLGAWFQAHKSPVEPLPVEARKVTEQAAAGQQGRLDLGPADGSISETEGLDPQEGAAAPQDVFELVWPKLAEALLRPRTAATVARQLGLEAKQAAVWLERARKAGRVRRRGTPARYFIPGA